ncbi:MAG: ATP-binding protein [bacterium]
MNPQVLRTADLLHNLFEATAPTTGTEFFKTLVRQLADILEVEVCFVAEITDNGKIARMLALWQKDDFHDAVEYDIPGTPCEKVAHGEIVQINSGLSRMYPGETMFGTPLQSYLGIPLIDERGQLLGHVAALGIRPMVEKNRDFSALKVLAARATAELKRLQTEEALTRAQAWLIQSEKLAAVGQLTAGVVHEINSPAGVIKSNAELVSRSVQKLEASLNGGSGGINGDVEKALAALRSCAAASTEAARRIECMVENLKKFTRVDEAPFQETDLHEGIDSVVSLLAPFIKTGVNIVKEYGALPMVHTSPSDLNQVFMTVFKNANEAIDPPGAITIRTWSDDAFAHVRVSDTGRGIPQETIPKLFDIGFSTRKNRVGMRVGLAIAYAIVNRFGGDIRVESDPGKGAAFTISLPVGERLEHARPARQ